MAEQLTKDMGRWASADLYLEYAYEAINEPKYKENCCSLWFEDKRIKSAVEWLNRRTYVIEGVLVVDWDDVKEAFPDIVKQHKKKA